MFLRLLFGILLFLPFSTVKGQTPPVSPQLLRTICQRVQLMGDNANYFSVAEYLEQMLGPIGFKRISYSETEWVYGKEVGLKEIAGGFVYDFQSPQSSVLQVSAYGRVTADLLFKETRLRDYYRQAIHMAGFVNPIPDAIPEVFVQVGGHDNFIISYDEEGGMTTVSYHVAHPTIAADILSPADAIAMVGIPVDEARQTALNIGYEEVQTKDNTICLLHGCQIEGESSPYNFIPSSDNEGIPFSAIILNEEDGLVKNVRLNIYRCAENVFLYDLSRAGFRQQNQKGKVRRFESDIQLKRSVLERLNEDSWTIFIEKSNFKLKNN